MAAIGLEATGATQARPAGRALAVRAAVALAVAALAGSTLLRFFIAQGQPLWLDETWTGAIAGQAGFAAFWRQVYLDVNAPLYYLVMHLWQAVFGLSDEALRLPSALLGAAAPLAVAFWGVRGLSRPARLTWAALLALWTPGIWLSGDARCYGLLLLLTTLQTLAFIRLLQAPGVKRAALWCGLAGLSILTHYHAGFLGLAQGVAYLALRRREAVRTWPAALLLLPVVAWLAVHAPRVAAFADPAIAWYPPLRLDRLGRVATYVTGSDTLSITLLVIAGVALAIGWFFSGRRREVGLPTGAAWAAAACAAAGALAIVVAGFLRPSYTDRYLTPFEPGLWLAVALIAQGLARRAAAVYAAAIVAAIAVAVPWAERELAHGWRWYNWEVASNDLMRGEPTRLVFLWDHPASAILQRDQLDPVGAFFFRRAGRPVEVRSVVLKPGEDPNLRLIAEAAPERSALIWAYDIGVKGTAARRYRPRLEALDPRLSCRNYARGSVGVVACDRRGSVKRPR